MTKKSFFLYIMAFLFIFHAMPFSSVQALTIEQLSADDTTINVYFHDDGADLSTITTNDISATLDGNPLDIANFKQAQQRINYMFLLDVSRSVTDDYMTAAKAEILKIYENLNEEDLLSVVTFGDEVHTVLDGDETLDEARAILDNIHCDNDYTHFYDAVDLLLDRLEGTADMRNIAVVVSDGINTGDANTSIDSLRNRLSGSGVAIYALAVDSAESSAINSFRQFIELSGGELFTFSPDTCTAAMNSLHSSVDAIWNVAVQVDPALATGETQSLEIKIGEHGTIQRDVILEKQEIDTIAPYLTDWSMDPEADTLALHFSEPMADLKNPNHFIITAPDKSLVPVEVLENTEDYVLLSIEGLEDVPGWRADFVRLMDASPNRNLIDHKTLLLTDEIVIQPETPVEDDILVVLPMDFIMEYWPFLLVLVLIILNTIISFFKQCKAKKLYALQESKWMIQEKEKEIQSDSETEEGKGLTIQGINSVSEPKEKKQKNKKEKKDSLGSTRQRRGFFWWLRRGSIVEETEASNDTSSPDTTQYVYDDDKDGKVHMSKGSGGSRFDSGAAPTRGSSLESSSSDDSSSSPNASNSEENASGASVNAPKRRRGLFGFLADLFSGGSGSKVPEAPAEEYEDSNVLVSEHRRGPKTPTTDGDSPEKNPDEYETDKVSEHRKNKKVRRARRNWFFWKKKKEIPTTEEVTKEETAGTADDTTNKTKADTIKEAENTEVDDKTARKYVKPKRRWFWQRKKKEVPSTDTAPEEEVKPTEESPADTEDEIDNKTARKYIKPRKDWFKKEVIPVAKQNIPESPLEDVADVVDAANKVSKDTDNPKDTESATSSKSEVPAKGAKVHYDVKENEFPDLKDSSGKTETSIKSGGFSLTGINADYRPSLFTINLKREKKLSNFTYKQNHKPQAPGTGKKHSATKTSFTPPSISSSITSKKYKSSKPKNINFTFTGDNQKKK